MSEDVRHGFEPRGRREVVKPEELTPVDEHRDRVLATLPAPEPFEISAGESLGLVLAEDVTAEEPLPPFANSAMDGYAVVAADVAGATPDTPVELEVTGEVAAGADTLPHVESGTTVRIMTGAPLPPGADAVVPVEQTSGGEPRIGVHVTVEPGRHVRTVGEDVTPGQRLLEAGRRIKPADIGLLSAAGRTRVLCYAAPRVAVIPTGDELVPAGRPLGPGRIRDSNGPMLAALVRQAGGIPQRIDPVPDDLNRLSAAFDSALGHADMIVTTGGASAGVHDLVAEVLGRLGRVERVKVAMKPGMPQIFAMLGEVPVFGLPGNPVSSFVSFEVFVRPGLRRLQGRRDVARPTITASLTGPAHGRQHKRHYVRVRLQREEGRWLATPAGHQGSHVLSTLTRADGLAVLPAGTGELAAGERVTVSLLVETS